MLSQEAKGFLLDNPDAFLAHFFKHRLRELKNFHLDLIRYATEARLGLIFYPAGHGKTTIVSELLPVWAICKDPNIRVANIAKDEKAAQDNTRSIQSELVQNTALIEAFGPFKPEDDSKAWSLTRFDVQNRTRRGRSSTFAAFGAGSRGTLGYRSDWTICDDVVTDKNSETPEQRDKLRTWFNQGPRTMAEGASGRLTVVGTLFHPEDLYHELRDQMLPDGSPMWQGDTFSAITDWDAQEVLWPEERPWLWLMEQKVGFGTLDFNKRYCNIAVDPSRQVFRDEYIRGGYIGKQHYEGCLDHQYVVGDYSPDWRRVAGFDPAVGTRSRSAKFCAHMTVARGNCAKHPNGCYWIVDLVRDQMTLPQQVEVIIDKHEEYDLFKSIVEANSYQAGLYQAVQEKMGERGVRYAVEPTYTNRSNKHDPELGVQAMSPLFENGEVHIPWGNPESRRKMQIFVDELIQYPGRTTDTVMSCWFGIKTLKESAPRFTSFNRLERNKRTEFWSRRPLRGRTVMNPIYTKDA